MRPFMLALAAALALAGCSSSAKIDTSASAGSTPAPNDATAAPSVVRPQASSSVSAGTDLSIALADPLVVSAIAQFRSQGLQGTPFAAYRGTQEQFVKLGCNFGTNPQPSKVEMVVYIKGTYTSPAGKASDTAMVQYNAPNAIATLYGNGAKGPAAWCTPPPGAPIR